MEFVLPNAKRQAIALAIHKMLQDGDTPAKSLLLLAGWLVAYQCVIEPAWLYSCAMFTVAARGGGNQQVRVTGPLLVELLWWRDNLDLWTQWGIKVLLFVFTIMTNALGAAGGAWAQLQGQLVPIQWVFSDAQSAQSATWCELYVLWLAVEFFAPAMQGHCVLLCTNNTNARGAINNSGSSNPKFTQLAREIWRVCIDHQLHVTAEYLPGCLNDLANFLSRDLNAADWQLLLAAFRLIDAQFGPHMVDWFVASHNAQLPRFWS